MQQMIPTISDKRPPFARFEEREIGLNQEATAAAGRPIPNVVVMACITPHGSKDVFEKPAEDWIKGLHEKAMRNEYPLEWVNYFKESLKQWKEGHELPREGTPIRTWQMTTREQATRLIAGGITTVEDLAEFPDSNLGVVGMDGRYLRDLARNWISEAKDKGANAKALADAKVEVDSLKATIERQAERLQRLEARLEEREISDGARPTKRKNEAA